MAVEIQVLACGYAATCAARSCRARATTIARYIDDGGPPLRQRELCERNADAGATIWAQGLSRVSTRKKNGSLHDCFDLLALTYSFSDQSPLASGTPGMKGFVTD